ncbi:MAG TPA: PBP1A family penicillin-binding protein [Campylobacterales bacterium]|nr:PBP1A family penicillin-binding protein [Campylobacterales bacterium]
MKILLRLIGLFFILMIAGVIAGYFYISKELTNDIDKLLNYNPNLTTKIYDRNGELISNIFGEKHRTYVEFKDIPPRLIEALVAIEDTAFFEHGGINPEAIMRAAIKDIKHMKLKEGASTLTQQLVKLTLLSNEKKIKRKINEAILAIKLETKLSKEEILERYLNEVFYGHRYYGVKTAAQGYFRKDLSDLNLKEMAILAGIPQRPSAFDPTRHLEASFSRANTVLNRMHVLGWISKEELVKYQEHRPKVYDDTLTKNKAPYIVNEVLKRLQKEYPDIKTAGYEIYTSIDLEVQEIARVALQNAYAKILERGDKHNAKAKDDELVDYSDLNGAMVVMESKTGEVLAMVGGVDYAKSVFNRAVQGKRQPGSSFKPFIYLTALNAGYSTQSKLTDISRSFSYKDQDEEKEWRPKNYEKNFEGLITLRESLIHSRNLATINMVNELGLSNVYQEVEMMGFKNMPSDLSISLGTFSISPLAFAESWSIFANAGTKVKPLLIKKVVSSDGGVKIYETQEENITTPEQAFLVTSILEEVVTRGTGRRARVDGIAVAGKTGTTNGYKDAWFCGYSPEIETIVWFGKDNNRKMARETGGKAAGPAFAEFYREYIKLHPETKREFDIPEGVREVKITAKKSEYFTDVSAPPNDAKSAAEELEQELLF